uniref:PglD N-terminal domain-containing protein n=1 Tax=Eutreptiella gymnastica TaxID=73025 RepID=A0A7S1N706_9EUGL|mmetsp:Transcript_130232/g.225167  ORF Transcript_130232/g.225167 Transcript_130232/m.225167 type:complete len:629 (+) Transcript_130232:22-1908(+)
MTMSRPQAFQGVHRGLEQPQKAALAILGAGSLAGHIITIARECNWPILGLFDDDPARQCMTISGVPVLGFIDAATIQEYKVSHVAIAVGNLSARLEIIRRLMPLQLSWPTLIHPQAIVAPCCQVGKGNLVEAGCVIGLGVSIGNFNVLLGGATIDSCSKLGSFITAQARSTVANAIIGSGSWLSCGCTIMPNISVGKYCFIGGNACVEHDVPDNSKMQGVPAVLTEEAGTSPGQHKVTAEEEAEVEDIMQMPMTPPRSQHLQCGERKINWCPFKPLDMTRFHQYILPSINCRHVTNGGPCQKLLADRFKRLIGCTEEHTVLTAANGTAALHALVAGLSIARGKPLKVVTQAITFAPGIQGPLLGSLVVEYDQVLKGPCLQELGVHQDDFDAVLLTNCFGNIAKINLYQDWCNTHSKLLLMDNAATPLTNYDGINSSLYATGGAIVSLHETKPIGRGEGGIIVVPVQYAAAVHQAMNFGFSPQNPGVPHPLGSNWRMSDIAAAAVMCHWDSLDRLIAKHLQLFTNATSYVEQSIHMRWAFPLDDGQQPGVLSAFCVTLQVSSEPVVQCLRQLGIECKQYYLPVVPRPSCPKSWAFYDHIVCMPIHVDMTPDDVHYMFTNLNRLCENTAL